jgi:hypothetical protein
MIRIILRIKLLDPENMRIGQSRAAHHNSDAALDITYKRLFVDAVAIPESVAIKENIAEHAAPFRSKEHVPTQAITGNGKSHRCLCKDIAETNTCMWCKISIDTEIFLRRPHTPFSFVVEKESRLIFELIITNHWGAESQTIYARSSEHLLQRMRRQPCQH